MRRSCSCGMLLTDSKIVHLMMVAIILLHYVYASFKDAFTLMSR